MGIEEEYINILHGAGGRVMSEFIREVIIPSFSLRSPNRGIGLDYMDDGGAIILDGQKIVMTIDAHTVFPIFFPGGDIGRLAVSGAINDLACMGARPLALALTLVIEEGFSFSSLKRILKSINDTSVECKVPIICGDTKVVEKGVVDQIIVSTCAVGVAEKGIILDCGVKPGDKIIVTGSIGDHAAALLACRENIGFDVDIKSDVSPLWDVVEAALNAGEIHAMKDPTRGGLSTALNELAEKSQVDIIVEEACIPIKPEVQAISEVLGIDPLDSTNEGKIIMAVSPDSAENVLSTIRKNPKARDAAIIGEAVSGEGKVLLKTVAGGTRLLTPPLGTQVPRVC